MREPNKAVLEHKKYLNKIQGWDDEELLGIFLYGSQNYNINTEKSDVDTKAIYIPDFEDAILSQRRYAQNFPLPDGEYCELMDIRHLVNNYRKQNINFIETLFTDYFWINPKYEDIWNKYFIFIREDIARYNIYKGVLSTTGQAIHTLKQEPHNGKKLANGYRFKYFLEKYVEPFIPYKNCITIPDGAFRDFILELKLSNEPFPSIFAETLTKEFQQIQKEVDENFKYNVDRMLKVDASMNKGIIEAIKRKDEITLL